MNGFAILQERALYHTVSKKSPVEITPLIHPLINELINLVFQKTLIGFQVALLRHCKSWGRLINYPFEYNMAFLAEIH